MKVLAIVNPAAGNGRCGRLAPAALDRIRASGFEMDVAHTNAPGRAAEIAAEARRRGSQRFLAVGGDGTAREVVSGLLTADAGGAPPQLALLPLGTGNSFLKDFNDHAGVESTIRALLGDRGRPGDVVRLIDRDGTSWYSINLIGLGLIARIADTTNRRFKALGEAGYVAAACQCLAKLDTTSAGTRADDEAKGTAGPLLFQVFSNSRYTGGRLLIAPRASCADGQVDVLRCAPISRLTIVRHFAALYDGSHLSLPFMSWRQARSVVFQMDRPEPVMIDGDVFQLRCDRLEVVPSALEILA